MMYDRNTQFVIAILHQGKVLREVGNDVFLPFDSEYSIRVKNPHSFHVCFEVLIDGTSITDSKIILPAHGTFDLERMIVDGDLTKGPRLKFVSKDGGNYGEQLADPTSSQNDLVEVRFYCETTSSALKNRLKRRAVEISCGSHDYRMYSKGMSQNEMFDRGMLKIGGDCSGHNHLRHASFSTSANYCQEVMGSAASAQCSLGSDPVITASCDTNSRMDWMSTEQSRGITADQIGGTVAGSETKQQFMIDDSFEEESHACAVLRLWIRGKKEPVLVKDTRYKFCASCGSKAKRKDKFCASCGKRF